MTKLFLTILISFTLSWHHPGADSFTIYRSDSVKFATRDTFFTDSTIVSGKRYEYAITAHLGFKESIKSNVVSGLALDWSQGSDDVMLWRAKRDENLLKILLPRSWWLCSWRYLQDGEVVHCICEFDVNRNGFIDLSDFAYWAGALSEDEVKQFENVFGKRAELIYRK